MVPPVGVEPTLTELRTLMLYPLSYGGIGGWYRICTYDAWVAATSLSLLGEPPLWCRREDLNLQQTVYKTVALPFELPRHVRAFLIIVMKSVNAHLAGALRFTHVATY